MPKSMTWLMAPAAAPAHFPYDHPSMDQTDTADPAAWRAANAARFERLYGAHDKGLAHGMTRESLAARRAAARDWHAAHKPHFDALYGP